MTWYSLSEDWKTFHTMGRILCGLGRYEEALATLEIAKQSELLYIERFSRSMEIPEENRIVWRESAEEWHDNELEYASRR